MSFSNAALAALGTKCVDELTAWPPRTLWRRLVRFVLRAFDDEIFTIQEA